jgi:hypothetical protein
VAWTGLDDRLTNEVVRSQNLERELAETKGSF